MACRPVYAGAALFLAFAGASASAQVEPPRPWHRVSGLQDSSEVGSGDPLRDRVAAEIALGNWERARGLLSEATESRGQEYPDDFDLWARASLGAGLLREAASWFAVEGELSSGRNSAIAFARAGEAYEALGWDSSAAEYYRLSGEAYPAVSGWLALRIARVSDDSLARIALRTVPESGGSLRQTVGAQIQLRLGNWSGAASIYYRVGRLDSAIAIAARAGDSTLARDWALEALGTRSEGNRRTALAFLTARGQPQENADLTRIAATALELGDNDVAVESAAAALAAGDSSSTALRQMGLAQERAGRRIEALESYRLSGERGGPDGASSRYSRGRLLFALRRYREGVAELRRFSDEFPEHPYAAAALETIAGWLIRQGDLDAADSVVEHVDVLHPRSSAASAARMSLAQTAAAAERTAMAERWYESEIRTGGRERHSARHAMSRLKLETGDTAAANGLLVDLAEADPLGYYGSRARAELGLPFPTFEETEVGAPSPRVASVLEQLDFLLDAGFTAEAETHVSYWRASDSLTPDEMLELADGMAGRGEMAASISLGWRASRTVGLRDARVVRAIFPWPLRGLIETEAREWGVDPFLVAAIVRQESAFDPGATSRAGARGLMQLMPATASWRAGQAGFPWEDGYLGVPDANLHIGIGHLADLLGRSEDIVFALAAYNAGGGNLARWLRREGMNDPGTFVERIPFPETQGYVKAVLRNRDVYRGLYGAE